MQPPIKSWSFSALRDFEACPYRAYLAKVERAPQPDHSDDPKHPLVRGDRVHQEAEAYIRGEGPLTKDLRKFGEHFGELRERFAGGHVEVEQKWGFNHYWQPVEWTDRDAWARIIADVVDHIDATVARVEDHKTGKSMGKEVAHTQQTQLYAVAAMLRYPELEIVEAQLNYLDEGKTRTKRYQRDAVMHFLERWTQRGVKMTTAMVFKPKPNKGKCRFCPFGTENGTGYCSFAVSPKD